MWKKDRMKISSMNCAIEALQEKICRIEKELAEQREKNARLQEMLERLGDIGQMIREDVEQERKRRQEHDKQWNNMMAWQPEAGWGVGDEH